MNEKLNRKDPYETPAVLDISPVTLKGAPTETESLEGEPKTLEDNP